MKHFLFSFHTNNRIADVEDVTVLVNVGIIT
jgi:hypothetical protein